MHQNEWFQVWFFKNFLGRGSPSPLPRPLPPLFLGLRPRFGLRPQFSGASRPRLGLFPSILGHFAPSIRASPSTFDWGPWFGPPKNKFLDPPLQAHIFKFAYPPCHVYILVSITLAVYPCRLTKITTLADLKWGRWHEMDENLSHVWTKSYEECMHGYFRYNDR